MGPGFRVCLVWIPKDLVDASFFEDKKIQVLLLGLIGLISFAHCWGYSLLSAYVLLRNALGLNLSS